jgi:septal ring factor EnvC (AmiA/AmiB activator)
MMRGRWLLTLALPLIAAAPPTPEQLQDADRARAALVQQQKSAQSRAATAAADEKRLLADRAAAAATLRGLEDDAAKAADRVAELAQRRAETQARLAQRAEAMAPFLPLIQRLALYPTETLLAVPASPEQAVRGILVLGGLTRQLEADAKALRAEQEQLAALQTQLDAASADLAARQAAQKQQSALIDQQLDQAHAQRRAAESEANDWARKSAAEAARADSIRAAIARLEADRAAAAAREKAAQAAEAARLAEAHKPARQEASLPLNAGPVPSLPGGRIAALAVPVAGSVVKQFGDSIDGGLATGITYQPPPSARVAAPCSGRVVFAGPFRSFGNLMIIDCGSQYHVVLSGFDRIDAQLGQNVRAGEPVGAMPAWNPLALLHRPTLLLELRHDGEPTNPAPYLRASS